MSLNSKFISDDLKLGFNDVKIVPTKSIFESRRNINLETEYIFPRSKITWEGIPIIASNMDNVATFDMAKALQNYRMCTAITKFYTSDQWIEAILSGVSLDYSFITFGIDSISSIEARFDSIHKITGSIPKIVVFDVPNGYIKSFHIIVSQFRKKYPATGVLAGNIVTPEGVQILADCGVDGVKIGIGSGSACSTSKVTGVGYPQLSAILECAETAEQLKILTISDGGAKTSGDISKAYIAGANFVMLGGMLAGHEEGNSETVLKDGKIYRKFYGMSSSEAMVKHYNEIAPYRASEGISTLIPDKGNVSDTVDEILGGIRSTCTYINSGNLIEMGDKGKFVLAKTD